MAVPVRASRDQVLAFRLSSHNLAHRLPAGSLPQAAAACGLQDSPPGSALLSLGARVAELTPPRFERAVASDRTLVAVRSLRTAPHFVPGEDLPVFTTALLPEDEAELRYFIQGAGPALDSIGIAASWVADQTEAELLEALDGRVLTFRQLSEELTRRLSRHLSPSQLAGWHSPSWYGLNHCLGEAVVHFALYVVALRGSFCFAPREGNEAAFVRTDQWLGRRQTQMDPCQAQAELVRRYLRCFGPSTVEGFGAWAGVAPTLAERAWAPTQAMLVAVDVEGKPSWLHEDDMADFTAPPSVEGVRLLPPHDPYLAQRDRDTLVPDRPLQRRLWRTSGNPGVVLASGQIVALWRPRKTGSRLLANVEPLAPLAGQTRAAIAEEAELVAALRGCTTSETAFLT